MTFFQRTFVPIAFFWLFSPLPALAIDLFLEMETLERQRLETRELQPLPLNSLWGKLKPVSPHHFEFSAAAGTFSVEMPDDILEDLQKGRYLFRANGARIAHSERGTLDDVEVSVLRGCRSVKFSRSNGDTLSMQLQFEDTSQETLTLHPRDQQQISRYLASQPIELKNPPPPPLAVKVVDVFSDSKIGFLVHLKMGESEYFGWIDPWTDHLLRALYLKDLTRPDVHFADFQNFHLTYIDDENRSRGMTLSFRGENRGVTVRSDKGLEFELPRRSGAERDWIQKSLNLGRFKFVDDPDQLAGGIQVLFNKPPESVTHWNTLLSEFRDPFLTAFVDDATGTIAFELVPGQLNTPGLNNVSGWFLGNRKKVSAIWERGSSGFFDGAVHLEEGAFYSPLVSRPHDVALTGKAHPIPETDLLRYSIEPGGARFHMGENPLDFRAMNARERLQIRSDLVDGNMQIQPLPPSEIAIWILRNPETRNTYVISRALFGSPNPRLYVSRNGRSRIVRVKEFVMSADGGSFYLKLPKGKFLFLPPYLRDDLSPQKQEFGRVPFLADALPGDEGIWNTAPGEGQRQNLEVLFRNSEIQVPGDLELLHQKLSALGVSIDDTFSLKHSCAHILANRGTLWNE